MRLVFFMIGSAAVSAVVAVLAAAAFAQSGPTSPDDWFAIVCGNNGFWLKAAVTALVSSYGAGLITDIAKKLPAPVAFVLNFASGSLWSAFKAFAAAPPPPPPAAPAAPAPAPPKP